MLQDLRLAGTDHGLTLGSDRVADYEGDMRYHGALIGPVVNRLTGAQAPVAGEIHRFEANQAGLHTLHGGTAGTHLKLWTIIEADAASVTLAADLPDGEGGFPGNRRLVARFALLPPATLHLTVTAQTDAATLMNVANHSYWNLDGTPCWDGHQLRILADRYLPTTGDFTPTGEIAAVAGSDKDFRQMRPISVGHPLLDTNFCLSDSRVPLRDVLWLRGQSGITMTVATTEPGIQVYDGRNAIRPGRDFHEGLAIEAQFWPDAPNQPGFPPIDLAPGDDWQQDTQWRFSRT